MTPAILAVDGGNSTADIVLLATDGSVGGATRMAGARLRAGLTQERIVGH